MLKAPDGSLRGVGFVQFIKPEDAARALAALHNKQASVSGSKSSYLGCRCACPIALLRVGGKGAASLCVTSLACKCLDERMTLAC